VVLHSGFHAVFTFPGFVAIQGQIEDSVLGPGIGAPKFALCAILAPPPPGDPAWKAFTARKCAVFQGSICLVFLGILCRFTLPGLIPFRILRPVRADRGGGNDREKNANPECHGFWPQESQDGAAIPNTRTVPELQGTDYTIIFSHTPGPNPENGTKIGLAVPLD